MKRHMSLSLLIFYSLLCFLALSLKAEYWVETLKTTTAYLYEPSQSLVIDPLASMGRFGRHMHQLISLDKKYRDMEAKWRQSRFDQVRFKSLKEENERFRQMLDLPPFQGYRSHVSAVLSRDAHDWFHSILIQVGEVSHLNESDPVITLSGEKVSFAGQVIKVSDKQARVLLVTDSLSTISGRVVRTGEQGAVEGQGTGTLAMNFLLSDSDIIIGDQVVTAGLGGLIPPDILLGTVISVAPASRESFKKAFLAPAVPLNRFRELIVLSSIKSLKKKVER